MRSLIITDLHHEHPKSSIERAIDAGIEKIVCLGDIETPQILSYLLDLKIKKRIIIGDHEYHHCHGLEIHSGSMTHDCEWYIDLWEDNPRERDFVYKYGSIVNKVPGKIKGIKVVDKIGDKKVCYVHGSLLEKESMHPGLNGIMWGRLLNDYYHEKKVANFGVMEKEGYNILFRGHDHKSSIHSFSIKPEEEFKPKNKPEIKSEEALYGQTRSLNSNKLYIVTIGAFEKGYCAVFDEDNLTIEFTNPGFFRKFSF